MIINTGGRTDTVQYYSDWLAARFSEGYVLRVIAVSKQGDAL